MLHPRSSTPIVTLAACVSSAAAVGCGAILGVDFDDASPRSGDEASSSGAGDGGISGAAGADGGEVLADGGCVAPYRASGSECVLPQGDGAKVVLFGGYNARYLGDTWEWDGVSWERHDVPGPPPRNNHAMAAVGKKVVLFGGYNGELLGDTWEWDGSAWSKKSVSGPSPRRMHAMATINGKALLFGGASANGTAADTWEYDGTSWKRLSVALAPDRRNTFGMASFGGQSSVVLFGGYALHDGNPADGNSDETWLWSGSSWTLASSGTPPARQQLVMATAGDKVVVFGGESQGPKTSFIRNDTWEYDGAKWAQKNVAGPTARRSTAMASLGDVAVLFSGGSPLLADTWEWNGTAWKERGVKGPGPRVDHAMATLPAP